MAQIPSRSNFPFVFTALVLAAAGSLGAQTFNQTNFDLYTGFYGAKSYTDPAAAANFDNRLASGFSFPAPIDSGLTQFLRGRNATLLFDLSGAAFIANQPASYIEQQRTALVALGLVGGRKPMWSLMTEWDQAAGAWLPNGRPRYRGLSRFDAYLRFLDYYQTATTPLYTYLSTPLVSRPTLLAGITDYSPNVFYAYDLGVDFCFLERGIDELGDLSTGIAFLRGAAAQVDRQWGIDISTWRTSNNLATSFSAGGTLLGGWSPSYLRRHFYVSYIAGAHAIHIEPTIYYYPTSRLNPFGEAVRDFADFALNRHPDLGRPAVAIALLTDHFAGFDTKHGYYNQLDAVWYQDLAYSDGDAMMNNFLKVAYPNHWLQGETPNAPFLDSSGKPVAQAFQAFLAAGNDPRPYEPMALTRWGDNLDVITTRTSLDSIQRYRVIALLGNVTIDDDLRTMLGAWVRAGGTLVVNTSQVTSADEPLLGVKLSTTVRTGSDSRWLFPLKRFAEPTYRYTLVTPGTAERIAANAAGDPLITRNAVGNGQVYLTTPAYLQSAARDAFLSIGTRLFDVLNEATSPAQVSGPPVEYIVNRAYGRTIVTVVNHSAQTWSGTVAMDVSGTLNRVREYTQEVTVPYAVARSRVVVAAQVPPYDLRVYAAEFSEAGGRPPTTHPH